MQQNPRIMVVDDEAIVCKRLKPALEKDGYTVEVFSNGLDALKRLDEQPFDVVVTDVKMETVDGLQVLERVMARSPETKVVLITGYATVELAREALIKGAFDFIAKPFRPSDLRSIIDRAMAESKRDAARGG